MAPNTAGDAAEALVSISNRETCLTDVEKNTDWLEEHNWDFSVKGSNPPFPRKNLNPKELLTTLKISNSRAVSALTEDCFNLLQYANSFSWSKGNLWEENKPKFQELVNTYLVSKWGNELGIPIDAYSFREAMYRAFVRVRQSRLRKDQRQESDGSQPPLSSAHQKPTKPKLPPVPSTTRTQAHADRPTLPQPTKPKLTPVPSTTRTQTHTDRPTLPQPSNPPAQPAAMFGYVMVFEFQPLGGGSPFAGIFEVTDFQPEGNNHTPNLTAVRFDCIREALRAYFDFPEEAILKITLIDPSQHVPLLLVPKAKAFERLYHRGARLAEKAEGNDEKSIRFKLEYSMPNSPEDVRQDVTTVSKRKRSRSVESQRSAQPGSKVKKMARTGNDAQDAQIATASHSSPAGGNSSLNALQTPGVMDHEDIDLDLQQISLDDEMDVDQPPHTRVDSNGVDMGHFSSSPIHEDRMDIDPKLPAPVQSAEAQKDDSQETSDNEFDAFSDQEFEGFSDKEDGNPSNQESNNPSQPVQKVADPPQESTQQVVDPPQESTQPVADPPQESAQPVIDPLQESAQPVVDPPQESAQQVAGSHPELTSNTTEPVQHTPQDTNPHTEQNEDNGNGLLGTTEKDQSTPQKMDWRYDDYESDDDESDNDELPELPEELVISNDDPDSMKAWKENQASLWIHSTADILTEKAFKREGITNPTTQETEHRRKYFIGQLRHRQQDEDTIAENIPSERRFLGDGNQNNGHADDEQGDAFSSLFDNQRVCEHISKEMIEEAWAFFLRESVFNTESFEFKDQGIKIGIMPHQMLGAYINVKRGYMQNGQIIGDEAGLGKTIQMLITFWLFAWLDYIDRDINKDETRVKAKHYQQRSDGEEQCSRALELKLPFRCPCHELTPRWLSSHRETFYAPHGFQLALVPLSQMGQWSHEWNRVFKSDCDAKVKMEILIAHERTRRSSEIDLKTEKNLTRLWRSIDEQANEDSLQVSRQTNTVILSTPQSFCSQILDRLYRKEKSNIIFSSVAVDECHLIRSSTTVLANFLNNKLCSAVKKERRAHKCISEFTMFFPMSGTPLERGPKDLSFIIEFYEYTRSKLWAPERISRMKEDFPELWRDLHKLVGKKPVDEWQKSIDGFRGLRTGVVSRGKKSADIQAKWDSTLATLHRFLPLVMMKRALDTNWLGKSLVKLPLTTLITITTRPKDDATLDLIKKAQDEAISDYTGIFANELAAARNRKARQQPAGPNVQTIIQHLRLARQLCGNPFYAQLLQSGELEDLNLPAFYKGSDMNTFWVDDPFSRDTLARNPLMKYAPKMWELNFRLQKIWTDIKKILDSGEKVVLLSSFPSTVAALAIILSWKCAKEKLCKVTTDPKTKTLARTRYPVRVGVYHSKLTTKERSEALYAFNGAQKVSANGELQWLGHDKKGKPIPEPHIPPRYQTDIFVGGLKVAGTGLNLQHLCSKLFIMEPLYAYSDTIQAIGRIYRIGQANPTTIYQITSPDIRCEATVADRKQFNAMIQAIMINATATVAEKVKAEPIEISDDDFDAI